MFRCITLSIKREVHSCLLVQSNLDVSIMFCKISFKVTMNQVKDIDIEAINNVQELDVTSAVLWASAHHIGNYCKDINTKFMQKRDNTQDPRATIEEGKAVTACAMDFFTKMKESCLAEFKAHYECLDRQNMSYGDCRRTQKPYNECVFQNLNLKNIQSEIEGFLPPSNKY